MARLRTTTLLLGWLALIAVQASAQVVGTVGALEGTAEIGRAGTWVPAKPGATIAQGDSLRTGRPGRLRVVFHDDSVLNLGDGTELLVDEQLFDPSQSIYRSTFNLLRGKVRALVSEYYKQPRAYYQVETVTAVVGVRGTEFIITYDPDSDASEVLGISDTVAVESLHDRAHGGVVLSPHELTTVRRGQFPTPPRLIDDELFNKFLQGVAFISAGTSESLAAHSPLIQGESIASTESAQTIVAHTGETRQGVPMPPGEIPGAASLAVPDASGLIGQSPEVVRQVVNPGGEIGIEF